MTDFIENRDYYVEQGKIIFTDYYLRKRGKCCGNDCRHCPYSEKVKNNTELKK